MCVGLSVCIHLFVCKCVWLCVCECVLGLIWSHLTLCGSSLSFRPADAFGVTMATVAMSCCYVPICQVKEGQRGEEGVLPFRQPARFCISFVD